MEMMENEQVKNEEAKETKVEVNNEQAISEAKKKKFAKGFRIAMVVMISIIAIILVNLIIEKNKAYKKELEEIKYDAENIHFDVCSDYKVYKFISDYFKARTALNFPKIFASFGRDYYKEKREDKKGIIDKIEDTIRYEKTFVRSYDDIKVYTEKGLKDGEVVAVVTYELALGFTDDTAPMIIIFYLEPKDDSYIIKEKLDVGTSKYLIDCINTEYVKALYNDVYGRLNRVLLSNEDVKLAYNSLRQFEMNMNGPINYEDNKLTDNFGIEKLDPVKDIDYIYESIKEAKVEESVKKRLDDYLSRIIASESTVN